LRAAHHGEELVRRNEKLSAVVGIGLAVKLLAERPVRMALKRGADSHTAIQGQLKGGELQPVVAHVGVIVGRVDLLH